jgi:hypothetical protein
MMIDRDLDRVIDRAAEQLIGREPSRAVADAVMAKVNGSVRQRRFRVAPSIAAAAAALVAVSVAMFIFGGRSKPSPVASAPPRPVIVPASQQPAPKLEGATVSAARQSTRPARRSRVPDQYSINDDASGNADAQIKVDPVSPEPMLAVDPLEIEPLVIEPLAAND